MNNKGFTVIELLATIVVLTIVTGIVIVSVNTYFGDAKDNTEEVFVDMIKDALDVYLTGSESKKLSYSSCSKKISKNHGDVSVGVATIKLSDVINSQYHPIDESDLVNPANKGVSCGETSNINIEIYRDSDFVYYYKVDRSEILCLKRSGLITNLPVIGMDDENEVYYSCN